MTVGPIEDADLAAHNALWAIPALLDDQDIKEAWHALWRAYKGWDDVGEWFDRHRELMAETNLRGIALLV